MTNEEFENYEEGLLEKLLYPEEEVKKEPKQFDGIIRGIIPIDRVKKIEKIQKETEQVNSLLEERNYLGLEKTNAEINGREYPCWTFQLNNQPASIVLFQDRWTLEMTQGNFKDLEHWNYRNINDLFNLIDNHIDKKENQELVLSQKDFNKIKNYSIFDKEIERIEKLEPEVGIDMRKEANYFLNEKTDIEEFKWIFEDYLSEFKDKYRDPYEEYMKSQEEAQKVKIDQIKVENEVLDRVMFKTVEEDKEVQHMILTEPESYSDERKALTYISKEDEIIKEEKAVNQVLEEVKNKSLENLNEVEQQEMDQIINQEINPEIEKTKHITERENNFDKWLELKESYDFQRYNVGTEEYEIPSYTFKLGNTLMCVVEGKEGSLLYQAENGDFDKLKVEIYEDNERMFKDIENFQAQGNNPQKINYYPQQMSNYVKVDAALKFVQEEDHELWNELHDDAMKELDGNEEHEKGFFVKFNEKLEHFKEKIHEKYENAKLWYVENQKNINRTLAVGFGVALLALPLSPQDAEKEKQFCQFIPEKVVENVDKEAQLEQGDITIDLQDYEVKMNMHEIYGEELAKANGEGAGQIENKEESKVVETESNAKVEKEEDKVIIEDLEITPGEKQDIEIEYDQSTAEKNPDGTINKDDGNIQDIIIQDTEKPDQSLDQNIEPEQPLPEVETPAPEQENTGPTISENAPEFDKDHYEDLEITPEEKDDLLGSLLSQTTNEEINEVEKTQSEIQEISKTIEEEREFSHQDVDYER